MGYHQAGFEVIGVDIEPQPNYPFEFHQSDAIEFIEKHGRDFDAIHASPPCQRYSKAKALATKGKYKKLIEPTREALIKSGKHYIIENVPGAPLINPTLLCGTMFGYNLYRHRYFETSFNLPLIGHPSHGLKQDKGGGKNRKRDVVLVWGKAQYKGYLKRARKAMAIDWMNELEIAEAIPPYYTKWIGEHLMNQLTPHRKICYTE